MRFCPVRVYYQNGAHQLYLLRYQKQINGISRPMVWSNVANDGWVLYRLLNFVSKFMLLCSNVTKKKHLSIQVFIEYKSFSWLNLHTCRTSVDFTFFFLLENAKHAMILFIKLGKKSIAFLLCLCVCYKFTLRSRAGCKLFDRHKMSTI